MTITPIPTERFDRYQDFVSRHSDNGNYNPEGGLEGLLSTLTPDPKGIVLLAMEGGEIYFSHRYLYTATLNWLEGIGLNRATFPITHDSTWCYCEAKDRENNTPEGSLVNAGAVVREVYYPTPEGRKTGYYISAAGRELAVPLVLNAIEFVNRASNDIRHRYDSMWRIFGAVQSPTGNRRQLTVYKIVKFLIENSTDVKREDVIEALGLNGSVISNVLNSLGNAGIIDYESPNRDIEGVRAKRWVTYSLAGIVDFDEIYGKMGRWIRHNRGYLSKVVEFIGAHPNSVYEANELIDELKISCNYAARILSALADIGVLKRESGFSRQTRSRAKANYLTKMLYDIVLEPAWNTAVTLIPSSRRATYPEKVRVFLGNYQEERSQIGPQGGEEVKNAVLSVLPASGEEVKTSYIAEKANAGLERKLNRNSISHQLNRLVQDGLVEKTRRGHYRRIQ